MTKRGETIIASDFDRFSAQAHGTLYQRVIESLPIVVYAVDATANRFLLIDGAVRALTGYEPQEFYEDYDLSRRVIHPDDREWVTKAFNKALLAGRPFELDYRVVQSTGQRVRHVHARIVPMADDSGRLRWHHGVVMDVTRRRQAEEALARARDQLEVHVAERTRELAASEAKWRSLVRTAPDHILLLNRQCRIEYINRPFEDCAEVSVVGRSLCDLFEHASRAALETCTATVLQTGQYDECDVILTDVHDVPRYYSLRIGPCQTADVITGLIVCATDVTQRRATQSLLAQRSRELQTLADNAPDIITRVDRALRFVFANRRWLEATGIEASRAYGRTIDGLGLPLSVCQPWERAVRSVLASAQPCEIEFAQDTPDGRRHYQTCVVPEFDSQGNVASVLGISRDVTARHEAEFLLRIERDIAVALGSARDLEQAAERVLDTVCSIEGVDCGGFYRVEPDTGAVRLVASRHVADTFAETSAAFAFDSQEAHFLTTTQPACLPADELPMLRGPCRREHMRAVAIVPISQAPRTMAVLLVASRSQDAMSALQRNALEAIATQIRGAVVRIEAEEALHASEHRLRRITDSMPVVFYSVEAGTNRFLLVRGDTQAVLGYPAQAFRDDPDLGAHIVHPADRLLVGHRYRDGLAARQPFSMECRVIHGVTKQTVWVHVKVTPILDARGQLIRQDAVVIDITAHREAAAALQRAHDELEQRVLERTSELASAIHQLRNEIESRKALERTRERLERAVENAGEGIGIWDDRWHLLYGNPALGRIFGCDRIDDKIGCRWPRFAPDQDHEQRETVLAVVKAEQRWLGRLTVPSRRGECVPVRASFTHFDPGDGSALIVGNIQDIQREEAHLAQIRKLTTDADRALERERSRIAKELHDECGQTLTALKMDVAWLEQQTQTAAPAVAQRLAQMQTVLGSMMAKVRDLSKSLRPSIMDHCGLSDAIRSYVAEFARRSGIHCEVTVEPDDLMVDDPHATVLLRIVQEALTNVARHANAKQCTIALQQRNGRIRLAVCDNGIGAALSALRGTETLGVVGMKERAVALGGTLQVENVLDGGVCVRADLPSPALRQGSNG